MVHSFRTNYRMSWLFIISIVSGILIGVAFTTPQLWWCAFPGVVLFLYGIESAKSLKAVLIASFLAGSIKAGIALSWYFTVYPADWLGGPTFTQQIALLGGTWLLSALSIGFGFVLAGFLVFHIRHESRLKKLILYPLFFVLGDIFGAFCFSIYTYGDGNPLNAYFGFSMLGYTLADHALLKHIASIAGIYGLTYGLVFLAGALSVLSSRIKGYQALAAVGMVFLFCISGYTPIPQKATGVVSVAAITTNFASSVSISESEQAVHQRIVGEGISAALAQGAQIVVLPEDVRFGADQSNAYTLEKLKKLPHNQNAVVVDSSRIQLSSTTAILRGFIYDIDGNTTYTTDKQFVVPVGEYLPILHKTAIALLGGMDFFEGMQYVSNISEINSDTPSYIPNVMFCFESGVANIALKKTKERRSALIAHPVSHGWFHTPTTLWNEERQMLIVQALQARTPILQAGNKAPSMLYRADGTVDTGTVMLKEHKMTATLFEI